MPFVLSPQAPLNTPVTEDVFSILTEKYRIPVPILPGKILFDCKKLAAVQVQSCVGVERKLGVSQII